MEDRDTIAYGFVDDVYVVVFRGVPVEEREWQMCLDGALYASQASRMLLVAGNVMPDVGQRFDLSRLHEKHGTRIALWSDSPAIHRVVTALKWSGIEADGFRIDDIDGMLAFLSRSALRARLSSALGPYLDRSWLHELAAPTVVSPTRSRHSAAHRGA